MNIKNVKYYNSNRKMYDKGEAKYTNLQKLVNHIKLGGDILVIDSDGLDITNRVLKEILIIIEVDTTLLCDIIRGKNESI